MRRLLIKGAFLIALLAALVKAYEKYVFPRDPARTIDPSVTVVSPADGRLVYVVPVAEGSVPIAMKGNTRIPLHDIVKGANRPQAGVLIGIFMSPFDVHYQRSPISGTVMEVSYHDAPYNHVMGSMFLRDLFRMKPNYPRSPHIVDNERNIISIANEDRSVYVVQIADQQVNKIECHVTVGDVVEKGQKIGMIRRGSQVDLFIPGAGPSDLAPLAIGTKVHAGETAIVT